MEELSSLWNDQEVIEDLKQKLLYATLELESLKLQANQELTKNKENIRNLLHLLQMAYKERDEAKNQLQKLLQKLMISHFHGDPTNPNSSLTDSNSHSYNSSPADSFFDGVSSSSPELSPVNMADSGAGFQPEFLDRSSVVIENMVKGKKLPEKGKLLQAVMESGPLLQTVLVAGPLPRWRNPPPMRPYNIPAVSGKMMNFSGGSSGFSGGSCFNNGLNSAPSSSFGCLIPGGKETEISLVSECKLFQKG